MNKILVLLLVFLFSCAGSGKTVSEASKAVQTSSSFKSHLGESLVEKVETAPAFVIEYLREMDNMPNYEAYEAKKSDLSLLAKYTDLLPEAIRNTMEEKVIGIYFIKNFKGGGFTDMTWDENNNILTFLVLNPDILGYDISEWITFRDMTAFVDDHKGYNITVDCGKEYKALMHTLIHEGAHVFDLYNKVTPYIVRGISPDEKKVSKTAFTSGTWAGYKQPFFKYDFAQRNLITAYGLSQPQIRLSESVAVYKNLTKTPFLSPYSSLSWAEDYAETVSWFWLTQILRQKYEVIITKDDKAVFVWAPCSSVKAKQKFELIGPVLME